MRSAWLVALIALLGGCASAFPGDALRSVDRSITVPLLHQDPTAYLGRRVMVGGDILATRPMPGATEVEVLAKPLNAEDTPRHGDDSQGRVIIRTLQFLDPAIYAEGRRLTVIGDVSGSEERKIGELPYRYPVLTAVDIRLWPREVVVPYPPPWPYYYAWPYPAYYGWRYRAWGPWPYWW